MEQSSAPTFLLKKVLVEMEISVNTDLDGFLTSVLTKSAFFDYFLSSFAKREYHSIYRHMFFLSHLCDHTLIEDFIPPLPFH